MSMHLPGTTKRGGSRKGAGRPRQKKTYSAEVRQDFLQAAKTKAKETGRSLGRVVVDIIYDETVQDSVRIGALKAWCDVVVTRESKHIVEEEKFRGPTIFLPAIKDSEEERELLAERGYFRKEDFEKSMEKGVYALQKP